MNITKVFGPRVLICQEIAAPKPDVVDGLVVSPASVNPSYFTGTITLAGENSRGLEVGQKVAYLKYGFEDMGDNWHLVDENAVLAIVE